MVLNDFLINETLSIKEVLRTLDRTGEKTLLVVDEQNKLLGTITDGDLRRYILSGKSITNNSDIKTIYNKNPIYIKRDEFSVELAKDKLIENKIELLPVLDEEGRVIDFTTWTQIFSGEKRDKPKIKNIPVVIMAGGRGSRLDPFTRILPKPLIPIGDRAIIDIIMEKFSDFGINEFYISINHKASMIKAYFEETNKKYSIRYIEEKEPLGTAGSLKFLQGKVKDSLMVSNCDILIKCDYSEIVKFHKENNHDITIVSSLKHFVIPYGICEIEENGLLTNMVEKPEYNFLVNTGMCVLRKNVLKLIPAEKKFHITDLINAVKGNKGKVGVFPISEHSWVDIGQWKEYHKSVKSLKLRQ